MLAVKFKKFIHTMLLSSILIWNTSLSQVVQDFTVTDTDGVSHSLYADYLDQDRVVVIKLYWAGCPPCNSTAKDVQELYVKWEEGEGKVEFLALATQSFEGDSQTISYIERHGITFPMVSPDGSSLDAIEQFSFSGTPTYIVVAPDRSINLDPGGLSAVDDAIEEAIKIEVPDCPTTAFRFTSNTELTEYQSQYPNCTTVDGNLTIDGDLTNLKGLENITTINGSLLISSNTLLDLSDLVALQTVTGDIKILESANLVSLTGLGSISNFPGSIELQNLPSLTSTEGLRNMRSVGGDLTIRDCDALTDLEGMRNLETVNGNLSVTNNEKMTSLSGLESLRTIEGKLNISSNNSLRSIEAISDLSLFQSIDILDNQFLSDCAISSLCGLLEGDLAIPNNIAGNASGCESTEAVIGACNPAELATSFSIQVLDAFDKPVEGVKLIVSSSMGEVSRINLGTTDPDGVLNFDLPNADITSFDDNLFLEYEAPDNAIVSGISVADLVRVQRHILGLEVITNPYLLIASDANGNGSISASDLVFMINVILGRRTAFADDKVYDIVTEDCTLGLLNCDSAQLEKNPGNTNQIRLRALRIGDIKE